MLHLPRDVKQQLKEKLSQIKEKYLQTDQEPQSDVEGKYLSAFFYSNILNYKNSIFIKTHSLTIL